MCFDPSARPPPPPVGGQAGGSRRLTLHSADGAQPAARLTLTTRAEAPGVVIIPDVRGLHPYYEALAEAVSDAGAHAVTFDLYTRTAGSGYRDADFDFAAHREELRDATLDHDIAAALSTLAEVGATKRYTLGFCLGGRAALMHAGRADLSGAIGFYGWPARQEEGGSSPLLEARAGRVRAPVLALFGEADAGIPLADRTAYAEALDAADAQYEIHAYPGAPHSFFDRTMDEQAAACSDAWERILRFMGVPARSPQDAD